MYRKKCHELGNVIQIVLPSFYRPIVMHELHDCMGHLGRDRTLDLLQKRFFWPSMTVDVRHKLANCRRCLCRKSSVHVRAPLVSVKTTQPLELLCIDFLSLETSKGG